MDCYGDTVYSVVTSVSVIMDTGNGSKAVFADAVGKPVLKPSASQLASPINLLNPDRYEFYTFDDNGELVKRLMTMEEIQGIIANGDGEGLTYNPEGLSAAENLVPEKKVDDVVSNVQNVLKGEMESHKNSDSKQPLFDTPDISSSWTMILPAIFGNSGEDIIPDKPPVFATPETIMIETSTPEISSSKQTTTTENVSTNELKNAVSSLPTTRKPVTSTIPYKTTIYKKPLSTVSKRNLTTTKAPYITKTTSYDAPALKDNSPQILLTSPSTKKPTSEKPQSFKIPISTQKTTKPVLQTEKPIKPVTLIPENKKTPPIFQTASSTTSTLSSIINLLTSDTQKLSSSTTNLWTTGSSSTPSPFIQATFSSKTTNKISENKFEKTTNAPAYSTSQPLISTFFEISDDKNQAPATESLQYQNSSSKTDITTQQYSTTNTPENTDLPLSTLGIQQNQADQKINENSSSTEPTKDNTMTETTNSNYYTVAQTSGIDKLAVTELLDQLLLTSTNIYQLNTELTDQTPEPPQEEIRFETGTEPSSTTLGIDTTKTPAETTTLAPKDVLKQSDSTTQANNLEQIMTEKSVVSSIEELLSQAIHDETEPAIIDNNESDRINQLISNLGDKPMSQAQSEAATVMSHLIGGPVDSPTLPTQTESVKNDSVFPTDETVLSESLGTLISQIVGSNIPSLSTTDYLPSTTHTLPNEDLSRTEQSDFSSLKITTEQILEPKTELYTPELTTDAKSATSEIVSTTIIPSNETANLSKPAKADLSFEVNFEDYQGKHGSAGIEKEDDTDTTTTVEYTTPEKENIAYTSAEPNVLSNKGTTENNLLASEDSTEAFSSTTAFDSVREETQTQALFFTTNRVALVTALLGNSTKTDTQTEPDLAIKKVTVKKEVPSSTPSIFTTTFEIQTKPSLNEKKDTETTWALVSTIPPRSTPSSSDLPLSTNAQTISSVELRPQSQQESGLEETTSGLDSDIYKFVELCNELSFGFWKTVSNGGISASRSLFVSPFAATSLLAMVFLGARGSTSGEMNEILKLDDMVTFNPHLIFRNVTESIEVSKKSGVAVSAIIRELYSDKSKGKLLNFYKERARQFYDGHVEEVNFKEIGDIIRRRTNLLVKRYTWGKISEYLKENTMSVRPPLAGVSVSIFQVSFDFISTIKHIAF